MHSTFWLPVLRAWRLVAFCALGASAASAATWIGAGANDNWSTTANWQGGFVPVTTSPGVIGSVVQFTGSTRITPVADAQYTLQRLDLPTDVYYTLSGQTLTLQGYVPDPDQSEITGQYPHAARGRQRRRARQPPG